MLSVVVAAALVVAIIGITAWALLKDRALNATSRRSAGPPPTLPRRKFVRATAHPETADPSPLPWAGPSSVAGQPPAVHQQQDPPPAADNPSAPAASADSPPPPPVPRSEPSAPPSPRGGRPTARHPAPPRPPLIRSVPTQPPPNQPATPKGDEDPKATTPDSPRPVAYIILATNGIVPFDGGAAFFRRLVTDIRLQDTTHVVIGDRNKTRARVKLQIRHIDLDVDQMLATLTTRSRALLHRLADRPDDAVLNLLFRNSLLRVIQNSG